MRAIVLGMILLGGASSTAIVAAGNTENADTVVSIAAGVNHTCAVTEAGAAWCWGVNGSGQLGDGTAQDRNAPVLVKAIGPVKKISAGKNHSCAVTMTEEAWCWGSNEYGKLGDGTDVKSFIPVKVAGLSGVVDVAAGETFSCAVTSDGSGFCWGSNYYGTLGNASKKASNKPVAVKGVSGLRSISASTFSNHVCAIDHDNKGWCWGNNQKGQLGNGTIVHSSVPRELTKIPEMYKIWAGNWHSCAIQFDGKPFCWGSNYDGQLGSGDMTGKGAMSTIPNWPQTLESVKLLSAGGRGTCAIDHDQMAWCWGYNEYGAVGDGTTKLRNTPVSVADFKKVSAIARGNNHTCAIDLAGEVYCWGFGRFGQLGNGENPEKQVAPVKVTFP